MVIASRRRPGKRMRAFTLVEIMITIFIIGLLLAIAVPNFLRYMDQSRGRACQRTLKEIMGAKERWAMDGGRGPQDEPAMSELTGSTSYLRATPKCPSGGDYTVGQLDTNPICSIGGPAGVSESHTLE